MGVKLKLTGYILVALIAILAYFHLECIKERNARSSMFDEFNPEVTDCHNVPLPFRYLFICSRQFTPLICLYNVKVFEDGLMTF